MGGVNIINTVSDTSDFHVVVKYTVVIFVMVRNRRIIRWKWLKLLYVGSVQLSRESIRNQSVRDVSWYSSLIILEYD